MDIVDGGTRSRLTVVGVARVTGELMPGIPGLNSHEAGMQPRLEERGAPRQTDGQRGCGALS